MVFQRTAVDRGCKYLLFRHALEDLSAGRLQLKSELRNVGFQCATVRPPAVREGGLREHMVVWDGLIRDAIYHSILDTEWPEVK
jgi:hypothetical protein